MKLKGKATKENWTKDETLTLIHDRAIKAAKKHELSDKEKERAGLRKTYVKSKLNPRLMIEKWV